MVDSPNGTTASPSQILRAALHRIWFVMRREFLAIWKDPRSRTVLILPPIVQLFVFSYAATFDVKDAPLAVLNEDMGLDSRDLVARFTASGAFRPVMRLTSAEEIGPAIEDEKVLAVLRIGPDFSRELASAGAAGRRAQVQVIVDGRHSNTAQIALSYVSEIVESYSLGLAAAGQEPVDIAASGARPGNRSRLITRAWFNPNLESRWFIIAGLVSSLTMIVASIVTSLSVARERELGTFEQLLVTPLRPYEILIGKMLPPALLALLESMLLTVIGVQFFGVPMRGDPGLLVLALACFLLSVTSIGLMVSSLSATQQQGMIAAFCVLMPGIILSGFATPIENMPDWIQFITYLDPLRYMLIISRGILLQDMPVAVVLNNIWPMLVIGTATASAAAWLFRNRLQ